MVLCDLRHFIALSEPQYKGISEDWLTSLLFLALPSGGILTPGRKWEAFGLDSNITFSDSPRPLTPFTHTLIIAQHSPSYALASFLPHCRGHHLLTHSLTYLFVFIYCLPSSSVSSLGE